MGKKRKEPDLPELDIEEFLDFSYGDRLAEYVSTADPYRPCHFIIGEGSDDVSAALEETLTRILEAGGTEDDVRRIMGAEVPEMYEDEYISIDRGYCICGQITYLRIFSYADEYRSYVMEWCAGHGVYLEKICAEMDTDDDAGFYHRLRELLGELTGEAPATCLEFCERPTEFRKK